VVTVIEAGHHANFVTARDGCGALCNKEGVACDPTRLKEICKP